MSMSLSLCQAPGGGCWGKTHCWIEKYTFICCYSLWVIFLFLDILLLTLQACWTVLPWRSLVVMFWTPVLWQLVSVGWFPTWWIPATPQASPVWDLSLLSQLSWYAMCFCISEVCFCSCWGRWGGKSDWNFLTRWQTEHVRMLLKDFHKHQEREKE